MKLTYPKNEKLKSKKLIEQLFKEGKSVSKYPLRLVYVKHNNQENPFQFGVSVSKKYFKKAAERNFYKRILRETYRHNQYLLKSQIDSPYAFMFFYQSKDKLPYEEINKKTIELFEKFLKIITEHK